MILYFLSWLFFSDKENILKVQCLDLINVHLFRKKNVLGFKVLGFMKVQWNSKILYNVGSICKMYQFGLNLSSLQQKFSLT